MHNSRDEIIYIGKAISLKNRVRQYFQSSRNKTAKIEQMVSHIAVSYTHLDVYKRQPLGRWAAPCLALHMRPLP